MCSKYCVMIVVMFVRFMCIVLCYDCWFVRFILCEIIKKMFYLNYTYYFFPPNSFAG